MSAAGQLSHLDPENAVRVLGHATHVHEVPHLIHVAIGTARLEVEGTAMTLHAQESLWLAAGVPHAARYDPGSLVLGPFLHERDRPPTRVHRLGVVPALVEVMTTLLAVAPSTREQVEQVRTAIGDVLVRLRTQHFAVVVPTHPVAAAVAREARWSDEPLAVLAARHGTSARHLQRLFSEETGLPFHRWRVRTRLNTAIGRLRTGDGVDRAARAAGYATRSGLLKALRRELDPEDLRGLLERSA